jgi:hypothetical protein
LPPGPKPVISKPFAIWPNIIWVIVVFDTAGEVLEALERSIGVVKIPPKDVEVS